MALEQHKCIIDADWTQIEEHDPKAYNCRCRRKRALCRDMIFGTLAVVIAIGSTCAINIIIPPAQANKSGSAPIASMDLLASEQETTPIESYHPLNSASELWSTDGDLAYIPLEKQLAQTLVESCEAWGVPLELALAVIERESAFDADAVGSDGNDIGLFQIRSSNHAWLAEETGADPLNPEGNIVCGVWFLSYLYNYTGSWEATLTCWRWGPGNGETSEYASAVLGAAENWRTKT